MFYDFVITNPLEEKSKPQDISYDCVNALNEHLFNNNVKEIRQIMTVAIMEAQAFLETLDPDTCQPAI